MKPGRELDILIAEKVMGWTAIGDEFDDGEFQEFLDKHPYSTDIAAAWEVVLGTGLLDTMYLSKNAHTDLWGVYEIYHEISDGVSPFAEGDTAPHAICLAALKAALDATTLPRLTIIDNSLTESLLS